MSKMSTTSFVVFIILPLVIEVYSEKPYKVCSLQEPDSNGCSGLGRPDNVICNMHNDSTDCILNIAKGNTDFGRITPEEALIATNFVNNLVVLGEFRPEGVLDDSLYQTVVLVRANYTGGFLGLKGKRYCHPGFRFDETAITDPILKQFEKAVLQANNAEDCTVQTKSGTLLEKQLKWLNDFFGPSCRPGPWIDTDDLNTEYYQNYRKLCEQCTALNKCELPPAVAPFSYSLNCLVDGRGDVALTTLHTVQEYFNRSENSNEVSGYQYLCPDGMTEFLNTPCAWSKQPWNLIVGHKAEGEMIKSDLQKWLSPYVIGLDEATSADERQYATALQRVLFPKEQKYNNVYFGNNVVLLEDYLIRKYRQVATVKGSEKCKTSVSWCTMSDEEQKKCEWLAQAGLNAGVEPVVQCIKRPSQLECLEGVRTKKADLVVMDTKYGYIAERKELVPLTFPVAEAHNLLNIVVVVKENESKIRSFQDLKNKKACLPEYGGIEWLTFMKLASEHKILSTKTCDHGSLISDVVGNSCMPGAHDSEHESHFTTDKDKLCSLCLPDIEHSKTAKTCNADITNKYYGNAGALKCLLDEGEFAVITLQDDLMVNTTHFRVLCKNGTLALQPGLNVDQNCVVETLVPSAIVSRMDDAKTSDIRVILSNFEKHFATGHTKAYNMFNAFNGTSNLLFKDSTTPRFDATSSNDPHIRSYLDLLSHMKKCIPDAKGSATSFKISSLLLIFTLFLMSIRKF